MRLFIASVFLLACFGNAQAQEVESRAYNAATTINFALYDVTGANLKVDATDGGTDCSIIKDEGAESNCTNDFVDEGSTYSLALSAAETSAQRLMICFVDGDAVDVYLPKCIKILTYGTTASAQFQDTTATDVWANGTRTLTSGAAPSVADIWSAAQRTITGFAQHRE